MNVERRVLCFVYYTRLAFPNSTFMHSLKIFEFLVQKADELYMRSVSKGMDPLHRPVIERLREVIRSHVLMYICACARVCVQPT